MNNTKITFDDVYTNKYIQESVSAVARKAVKAFPALVNLIDEIKQDLWLEINKALPAYDPQKVSIETFFRVVIDRRSINIIRRYQASLCKDVVSIEDLNESDLVDRNNSIKRFCMMHDLKAVFQTLPPEQKRVCRLIMQGHSQLQVAKRMGISPSYLSAKYIRPIRQRFKEANLDQYLNENDSAFM